MLLKGCSLLALRRRAVSIPLAVLTTLAVYTFWEQQSETFTPGRVSWPSIIPGLPSSSQNTDLTLPELAEFADSPRAPGENAEFCNKRFTAAYLEEFRDHSVQYCDTVKGKMPKSRLTCFHGHVREDRHVDSFCYGTGATWDAANKKFRLDCPVIRPLTDNETADGMMPLGSITMSWFNTGPRTVIENFVKLTGEETETTTTVETLWPHAQQKESFIILVKREGNNNLWHSLMEIWSMINSVDILRIARQKEGRRDPVYETPMDLDNTYVVMLDDYVEESTFDLWRFFAPNNKIVKFKDMVDVPVNVPLPLQLPGSKANIIVPMSGASNPLWQNDWTVRDCHNAPLLKLFVRRVFDHFEIPLAVGPRPHTTKGEKDITITFIDRRGSRQLLNQEPLFNNLQEKYPKVIIDRVDFATLSLPDQVRLVQDTDILVGVHGAGLTHTMFLREGAGAVVEIQPENLGHKGFRNLATMMDVRYFSAEAEMVLAGEEEGPTDEVSDEKRAGTSNNAATNTRLKRKAEKEKDKPWQSSNVRMEEGRFMALMDAAIESISDGEMHNHEMA